MKRLNLFMSSEEIKDKATILYLFRSQAIKERWTDREIRDIVYLTYGRSYKETFKILKEHCK